ncbi:MAG: PEP-CTERM sorting domain-containing protein [Verrucomicrobiae bacterium]|nr:PEP-CTERM sorting domain-containing protein [Verrucomicrobiae bacterium]
MRLMRGNPVTACAALALCGAAAPGQTTYTNTITGNVTEVYGVPGNWDPNGIPGFYLTNLTEGVGNSNDVAQVDFRNTANNTTQAPQLDLLGSNYVLASLILTEDTGAGRNSDGNIISTAGPSSLALQGIIYAEGGRTIDLQTNVAIIDWADGNAFRVDTSAGNTLDFGGELQGGDGIRINSNNTLFFRRYGVSYGAGVSNGMIFEGAAGGTKNFWIDASSGDVVHDIPNMVIDTSNDNNQNIDFGRSVGTNTVTVNISNVIFNANVGRFYLGGGSEPDGSESTTVNVRGPVVFGGGLGDSLTNKYIQIDSVYGGVVNFQSNIVQNHDTGTDARLILQGNGVVNILADMTDTNGGLRSLPVRIDGSKGLTVGVDAESRLGTGEIDIRSGSVLRLNYDVFGDANGYPGGSLTNRGGVNGLNDTYLDFGVAQSGFFDPVSGDTNVPLTVTAFNGIAGNLTGARYNSDANPNVLLQTNAIIGENAINKPTFADIGQALWAGIRDAGGTYTNIGLADGTNIFRGVAIGALTPQGNGDLPNTQADPNVDTFLSGFHGTLSAAPGTNLEVLLSGEVLFTARTNGLVASFNADTGVANVRGPGNMILQSRNMGAGGGGVITPLVGDVTNINRVGRAGNISEVNPFGLNDQNQITVDMIGSHALFTNMTLTVTDGQVRLRGADNLGNANNQTNRSTLVIGAGASLRVNDGASSTPTITLNRGKIIFQDDGAFYTGGEGDLANANAAVIAAMGFGPNSMLVLNDSSGNTRDLDSALYNHLLTNMNIVWGDDALRTAIVQTASSFALGEGKRLTGRGNGDFTIWSIQGTNGAEVGLRAAAGVSNVILAPRGGGAFTIQTEVNLTNSLRTTVGAEGTFVSVLDDQTTRTNIAQYGQAQLYGPTNLLNEVHLVAGANLFLGDEPSDVSRVFGDIVVNDSTQIVSALRFNGGDGEVFGDIHMDGTVITNAAGGALAPSLQFYASNTVVRGSVYVGPTNAGTGSSGIDFGADGNDSTTITGDLVIDTPAKRSNAAQEFSRGDLVVSNNIIINASGVDYRAINGTNVSTYHGGSRLLIEADFDTNQTDGIGFHDRLVNGTLAQGSDGIVIRDFGALRMDFVRTNLPAAVDYTIGQKITVDNTGPKYWFGGSGDGRVIEVTPDTNIIYGIPSGGNPTIELTNVWMRDGSFMRLNSANATVRLGITVDGPATNGIATLSDTAGGNVDAFDLLDVRSGTPGVAKVLQIGATNGRLNPDGVSHSLDDMPFTNSLRGVASPDVTLDVFSGRLTVDQANGGDIQGGAIVRAGSSLRIGTSGTGTEALMHISGDGTVLGNLIVSNTLAPGLGVGTLTFTGGATFLPSSVLEFELALGDTTVGGGVNDLLVLGGGTGDLALDGTLNVTNYAGGTPSVGDFWTLIIYEGSLVADDVLELGVMPELGGIGVWQISNTGGSIILEVVIPEPSTWALVLVGLGTVGVLGARRRMGAGARQGPEDGPAG